MALHHTIDHACSNSSEAPLTITMYDRMAVAGSTPVLDAVSFFPMVGSGLLVLNSTVVQREREPG